MASASVDQATTSVETLTSLVQQVLQSNQDLCARLGSLELSSSGKKTPSAAQAAESDEEDDTSTNPAETTCERPSVRGKPDE